MSSTNEPEPEPVDTTDKEDAQVLLADPEDYHHTQRLREIHDARRNVHKTLRQTEGYVPEEKHIAQRARLCIAVTAYITELEPLFDATDAEQTLPDNLPWTDLSEYATTMGAWGKDDKRKKAPYECSTLVFREANRFLAEVKPLIEEEETKEWEV